MKLRVPACVLGFENTSVVVLTCPIINCSTNKCIVVVLHAFMRVASCACMHACARTFVINTCVKLRGRACLCVYSCV